MNSLARMRVFGICLTSIVAYAATACTVGYYESPGCECPRPQELPTPQAPLPLQYAYGEGVDLTSADGSLSGTLEVKEDSVAIAYEQNEAHYEVVYDIEINARPEPDND